MFKVLGMGWDDDFGMLLFRSTAATVSLSILCPKGRRGILLCTITCENTTFDFFSFFFGGGGAEIIAWNGQSAPYG